LKIMVRAHNKGVQSDKQTATALLTADEKR